jgi:L-ascorbate metabolism protein UlaG (beta-lactamase superfamily)
MMIRWIGQSGYVLKTATTEIIIDPYLSDIVNKVAGRARLVEAPINPAAIRCDAVICTHDHLDHLDTDAVAMMPKNMHFITTGEGKERLNGLGQTHVTVLSVGQSMTVGDIQITAVYANHTVDAFGLIVKAEGKTLYFSGDTLFDEKLFEISQFQPDYTFICINGKLGNMNVEEAILTATKIGAPVNIPTHYGMFASNTEDPHKFADHIPGGRILEFNRDYEFPL